jgi:uncharacterized protein
MELSFIDMNLANVIFLFIVGFVGGLVSGFIGSGGAFVLTPAMMNMGVSAIMAVASNMCHKFPKALVGAMKRHKYGQVDVKLGIVMGISAEAGVLYGAHLQEKIVAAFGKAGSNLYVSVVFVVVLAIVGSYVLRDAWKMYYSANPEEEKVTKLAKWVQSVKIPGTMVYFKSINTEISVLFTLPLGFATGMLAATIAVGGFIGVPAMMYILGVPGLIASATELVIAFIMGMGGTIKFAWSGFVDIRLAMIILAGSLFGIQLGAIGTTYVKPYMVKLVMGVIMLLVLFSRGTVVPVYLSDLDIISKLTPETISLLKNLSFGLLIFALATGAFIVLSALLKGMRQHRAELAADESASHFSIAPISALSPTGRFDRLLLVTDNSKFSNGAIHDAINMAKKCKSKLHVLTILPDVEHDSLAHPVLKEERDTALRSLNHVQQQAQAAGVTCEILLGHGSAEQEIVEEAEYSNMDMIIMGRRDKNDLLRSMMGSTTQKVIAQTRSSVMIVPHHATFANKGIILPVDGSRYSDAAATTVLNLVKQCSVPVTVVAVAQTANQEAEAHANAVRIQQLLGEAGVTASVEMRTGAPDTEIVAIAKERGDLIVMGSHGRSGLERLLSGSVSERVIGLAECPVLVVKL